MIHSKKAYALLLAFLIPAILVKGQVTTNGRSILVNGNPYIIRGITYNPVPVGSSIRSWNSLAQDIALMKEAKINTVRIYAPVDIISVLDAFSNAGIKVIVSFGYNSNGTFDILSGSFINYIKKYKNHPAILLWELGNEYNYHPEWFSSSVANWYTALNNAAAKVHQTDTGHPAATAHGELPNDTARSSCPNVDVWGMNVYRGDNPASIFPEWAAVSGKPMYISETGADSYMTVSARGYAIGPNPGMQADAVNTILTYVFQTTDINSGVCLFSFVDEWWKAGNNYAQDPGGWAPKSSSTPYDNTANEEYWGIVDIYRKPKNAFSVVKDHYTRLAVTAGVYDLDAPVSGDKNQVYPNPAENSINVNAEVTYTNILLRDCTGRIVYSRTNNYEKYFSIDVATLPSGAYVIQLQSQEGMTSKKFFKL